MVRMRARPRAGSGVRAIAAVLVALLAAVGCGGPEPTENTERGGKGANEVPAGSAGSAEGEQAVVAVTPYTVRSLDPIEQGLWSPEWGYGELLMRATEDGTVEPWLAESLEPVNPEHWRLTLNDGVRFGGESGTSLDAAKLVEVIDRHVADNPLVESRLPGLTAKATGDLTVELATDGPSGDLPNLLADERMISIFDPDVLDAAGEDPAALVGQPLYTGPFTVTSLTADEMVLESTDGYWGGDVALAGATVQFVPEPQVRVQAVRSGQADLALYPPTQALAELADAESGARSVLAEQPLQQLRAFLNSRHGPMGDPAVRQAFAAGLDYQQIAEQVMDGIYRTPIGMYPEQMPYAERTQSTDPERAERLLDQAGWERPDGGDGVRERDGVSLAITVLTYPQQPDTGTIAVAMKSQLDPLGFEVHIAEVPGNYEAMEEPDGWDVGLSFDGTLGYTYNPLAPLRDFLSADGQYNFGGVDDPELDAMIETLAQAENDTARSAVLGDIQQIVADNAYTVIVAQRSSPAIVGDRLADYRPSSVLHHLTARTDVTG